MLKGAFGGPGEKDAGAAFAAPGAGDGLEGGRTSGDEFILLCGSELDHATLFIGIAEGGEDFSGDAEVGVVHVLALLGLWKRKGEAAEVSCSGWHGKTTVSV